MIFQAKTFKSLNEAIAGFVESARRVKTKGDGRRARKISSLHRGTAQSREQIQAVRQWARQHGHSISNRGRIPASIQQAFDQAHHNG
ncbi:MAG: Lsr2 family protein [Pseudonocardiales bacterium]|nr:Lsr2 family protein [Pseudonocardiales bacterium]